MGQFILFPREKYFHPTIKSSDDPVDTFRSVLSSILKSKQTARLFRLFQPISDIGFMKHCWIFLLLVYLSLFDCLLLVSFGLNNLLYSCGYACFVGLIRLGIVGFDWLA